MRTSFFIPAMFMLVFAATGANAENAPASHPFTPQHGPSGKNTSNQDHKWAEHNHGCQKIVEECKRAGFIVGQYKKDNGLWLDCFDPLMSGKTVTRYHHSDNIHPDERDIRECKAAKHEEHNGAPHH